MNAKEDGEKQSVRRLPRRTRSTQQRRRERPSPQPPTPSDSSFLEIGKVVAVQGLKGEVRVYPASDFPERFVQPGQRWILRAGELAPQPIELTQGRYLNGKGLYVVQFAGVTDRTQAELLLGSTLLVPASDRPSLEAGEFHLMDLIGLKVFDQATDRLIGTVISVLSAGNDLLEVQPESDGQSNSPVKPILVPFVMAIVPVVDLEQGRIELTPPDGLLD